MINCAIVGVGRWGQLLVTSAEKSKNVTFTHGVTRTPEHAEAFCSEYKITLTDNFESVLVNPAVDAVVLATPHTQHFDQIIKVAKAGKHVFCEKPYTLSRAQAAEALSVVADAGVKTAVGHNRRFAPNYKKMSTMIEDGTLGETIQIEGNFSANLALEGGAWRSNREESPAGGMTSLGIHLVDAFINMFGPISEVRAFSKSLATSYDIDDATRILFEFENGKTGYLGTVTGTSSLTYIRAFGTKGWAAVNDQDKLTHSPLGGTVEHETWDGYAYPTLITIGDGLEAFAADIGGGPSFPVLPDEILHGIAVLDAIFRSIETGIPVEVEKNDKLEGTDYQKHLQKDRNR